MPTTKKRPSAKPVIGWREWIGLPDLGVARIKAKIDTGARTSSLHAFRIKKVSGPSGPEVEFFIHPVQHQAEPEIACRAPVHDEREIRSSTGHRQTRYVIITRVALAGGPHGLPCESWPIELTLTSRDEMGFRMLLGRQAVRGRFMVDPGASFLFLGKTERYRASALPRARTEHLKK
ncbi:MAG: ATP-dependent zinc protease [Parvularculaceae bacterium]